MVERKSESVGVRKSRTVGPSLQESLTRPWYRWSASVPLSVTHPELAKEWHPTKNGILTPDDFTYGSQKKRFGGNVLKDLIMSGALRYSRVQQVARAALSVTG